MSTLEDSPKLKYSSTLGGKSQIDSYLIHHWPPEEKTSDSKYVFSRP